MSGFEKWIPSLVQEYEIYEPRTGEDLEKIASVDLPDDFVYDPDYLYLWVRIVSAGEYYGPNKNGDYFPEQELVDYYHTFKNAHPFKNHENKKVENAIGQVLDVRWNPVMKCVEIFKGIDRKRAPEVVRGFLKGYLTDVSMGCRVPYTICSVCGNKARKRSEFCKHVNNHRMQYLGNGERVFEINFEPSFHDSSVVLSGAERVAKALMIIDAPPQSSVVSFKKIASNHSSSKYVRLSDREMEKIASYQENRHPFFKNSSFDKVASEGILLKLAELEKELTGKLLNVISTPDEETSDSASHVINIVKFLTEKRLDDENVMAISETLKNLADSENLGINRVFSTFISIAELLGIELYPQELHKILTRLTDATFNSELDMSPVEQVDSVKPDVVESLQDVMKNISDLTPKLDDLSEFIPLYDESAHDSGSLMSHPIEFMDSLPNQFDMDFEPPTKVVKVIKMTLKPLMPMRSNLPDMLIRRLAPFLEGMSEISGGSDAAKDLQILSAPKNIGDLLANIAYNSYQTIKPILHKTKMVRIAKFYDSELEKISSHIQQTPYAEEKLANDTSLSQYQDIVRKAEEIPSGDFSALNNDFLSNFAEQTALPSEKVAALKVATLLQYGGFDKSAEEVLDFYDIRHDATGVLLKHAAEYAKGEMEKIANDFLKNLLIDTTFNPLSLSTTIPGRLLDAYVFTKVTDMFKKKDQEKNRPDLHLRMSKNLTEALT